MQFPLYWFLFRRLVVALYFAFDTLLRNHHASLSFNFLLLKSEYDRKSQSPGYEKLCLWHKVPQLNILIKSTDNWDSIVSNTDIPYADWAFIGRKEFANLRELATRCITKEGACNKETICIINWLNNQFIYALRPCRPVYETIHEKAILLVFGFQIRWSVKTKRFTYSGAH